MCEILEYNFPLKCKQKEIINCKSVVSDGYVFNTVTRTDIHQHHPIAFGNGQQRRLIRARRSMT
jgi:hypothetical protein